MAPTIYDVARHAGVSTRTVTNVLSGYRFVTPATRAKVEAAVSDLGYTPNPIARNLRMGRSGAIAVAIPELRVTYFSELCDAIVDEASRHSYTIVIQRTNGDAAEERRLLEDPLRTRLFDGLIFSPLGLDEEGLQDVQVTKPVVMLGERVHGGRFDHVSIDNVAAARDATSHLISLGRRRIAAIGGQLYPQHAAGPERTQGYQEALESVGLAFDESLVMSGGSYDRQSGFTAMARLLEMKRRPDAVFCYNDLLAMGAVRMLLTSGLRVPEDVAVVGFDDIEEGRFSTPSLTTISPNKAEIAALAVDRVFRRLEGDVSPPVDMGAKYDLIIRESSGAGPTRPVSKAAGPQRRPSRRQSP